MCPDKVVPTGQSAFAERKVTTGIVEDLSHRDSRAALGDASYAPSRQEGLSKRSL